MYSTIRLGRTQQIAWQRMFRLHLAESNPRSRMNPIHPTQLRLYRLPPNPRPAYPLSTTSLITSTGGFRAFYLVVLYFERYVVMSLTFIPPPSHPAAPVLGQLLVGHMPHCRIEVNAKTTRSRTYAPGKCTVGLCHVIVRRRFTPVKSLRVQTHPRKLK